MPPRRSTTRGANILESAPPASLPAQPSNPVQDDFTILRKQWKWAAFSQFYCTFFPIFSLSDVLVVDIERDIVHSTNFTISRVMQKMLYTLSYDRKISVDNWQHALRKQYLKRDPDANPLGSEPEKTRHSTKELDEPRLPTEQQDLKDSKDDLQNDASERDKPPADEADSNPDTPAAEAEPNPDLSTRQSSALPKEDLPETKEEASVPPQDVESTLVDWFDLPLLTKLESLHTVSEWLFQNPTRLRMAMKSDDEIASWRIEPIGYDSKRNAYWYIGDRLWIQREPPKPPRTKPLKRKRAPSKRTRETPKTPSKRVRLTVPAPAPVPSPSPASGRHSRAAKDQAKLKLDEQARELAELNRQANMSMSSSSRPTRQSSRTTATKAAPPAPPPRPAGTRISARLRGPQQDDEWQPIPEEWLKEDGPSKPSRKTGLESDEDSELTELSDDGATPEEQPPVKGKRKANGVVLKVPSEDEKEEEPAQEEPVVEAHLADFVEWETICVTLQEWEHVAEQFEKATHYAEKALYKILMNEIVPFMVQELKEVQRKIELEEAMSQRKRSSRLAIRESEKEQAIAAQKKQIEDEEKMSRTRRLEARQQKEEAERIKRESAREQRRQEREAREEARRNQTIQQEAERLAKIEKAEKAEKEKAEKAEKAAKAKAAAKAKPRTPSGQQENHAGRANGKKKSSKAAPGGEEWELDCEICHKKGKNLQDDGTPMVSCGRCFKWQHIPCHELADRQVGRARRNWESVDFVCKACALAQLDRYRAYPPISQHAASYYNVPQTQSYAPRSAYGGGQPGQAHAHSHGDSRGTQAYIQPRDAAQQQSYYMRPPGQNQQMHGSYPASSSSHHAAAPSQSSSLSFNHYQPSSHGYSSGAAPQKESYYSPYNNTTQQSYSSSYSHHQPYGQGSQHYRPPPVPQPSSYSKSQESWNVTTPANGSGYSSNHNGVPLQSSAYRSTAALDAHSDMAPLRESQQPAASSYARYSSGASASPVPQASDREPHYPAPAQYNKHYPVASYPSPQQQHQQHQQQQPQSQPPLDRS